MSNHIFTQPPTPDPMEQIRREHKEKLQRHQQVLDRLDKLIELQARGIELLERLALRATETACQPPPTAKDGSS